MFGAVFVLFTRDQHTSGRIGGVMRESLELVLATEKDAELLHQMKYEVFLPLYKKYHDDETSPVKEPVEKVIRCIQMDNSDYYLIKFKNEFVGGVRVAERQVGIFHISPIFILPQFQNRGIVYLALKMLFTTYPQAITWRLDTILEEKGNCFLYKKCGFIKTGKKKKITENMTLIDYEKSNVVVRRFCEADAEEVAGLIIRNFKEVNSKDYSQNTIQELVKTHDAEWVKGVAGYAHMYVFCLEEKIIGVGSISSFWGSETESILLTVFVLPEFHGKGVGRTIIRTLEQDELFIRAERVEIPASITAVDFYQKFGYRFKNDVKQLDEEGHFRLEKFKQRGEYKK